MEAHSIDTTFGANVYGPPAQALRYKEVMHAIAVGR